MAMQAKLDSADLIGLQVIARVQKVRCNVRLSATRGQTATFTYGLTTWGVDCNRLVLRQSTAILPSQVTFVKKVKVELLMFSKNLPFGFYQRY